MGLPAGSVGLPAGACLGCLRNSDFSKTVMLKLHILGRWGLDELVLLWPNWF